MFATDDLTNQFFDRMKRLFNQKLQVSEESQKKILQESREQVLYILSNIPCDKTFDAQVIDFCEQSDLTKVLA